MELGRMFGAVNLNGVLKRLGDSERACARLVETLGPSDGALAVKMIRGGELHGDIGDEVYDFFVDEIVNGSKGVWSGTLLESDVEPGTCWPITIREYCGIFFVSDLEEDDVGYFLSVEDALKYIKDNYVGSRWRLEG